jgi:hypothetical protein
MTWPIADEWRVSECDIPLVIYYDLTYGWWVKGMRVWPTDTLHSSAIGQVIVNNYRLVTLRYPPLISHTPSHSQYLTVGHSQIPFTNQPYDLTYGWWVKGIRVWPTLVIYYDLTYGWWVKGIWVWPTLVIYYDLTYGWWVEGISPLISHRPSQSITNGWSHSDILHSSAIGQVIVIT